MSNNPNKHEVELQNPQVNADFAEAIQEEVEHKGLSESSRGGFIKKVYGILASQLTITAMAVLAS